MIEPTPGHPDREPQGLALGCFASLCRDRLSEPLVTFTQAHPRLAIGVHERSNAALLSGVRAGNLAIAISPSEPVEDLASIVLWTERVVALMNPRHPLAASDEVILADLTQEMFLTTGDELERFLLGRLFPLSRPRLRMIAGENELRSAVSGGEAIALSLVSRARDLGPEFVTRAIADSKARITIRGFWNAERAKSGPLKDAIALLRTHVLAERKAAIERGEAATAS